MTKTIKEPRAFSVDEMREVVRKYVAQAGSLQKAADQLSTSPSHLSEILAGKRSIGDSIAAQLGFEQKKQSKTVTVIYYLGA